MVRQGAHWRGGFLESDILATAAGRVAGSYGALSNEEPYKKSVLSMFPGPTRASDLMTPTSRSPHAHPMSSFVSHFSLAYSVSACLRIGISGSASFHRVRKS